jgi:hypothetical protein
MCVIYDVATRFCSIYLDFFSVSLECGIWAYEELVRHADPKTHDFDNEHVLEWDQNAVISRYFRMWIGLNYVPRKSGPMIHGDTFERYLNPNIRKICKTCITYLNSPYFQGYEDEEGVALLKQDQNKWGKDLKYEKGEKPIEKAPQYEVFKGKDFQTYLQKMEEGQEAYEEWIEDFIDKKLGRPKPKVPPEPKVPPKKVGEKPVLDKLPSIPSCPMCRGPINGALLDTIERHGVIDNEGSDTGIRLIWSEVDSSIGTKKYERDKNFIRGHIESDKTHDVKKGMDIFNCLWCGRYYGFREQELIKKIYVVKRLFMQKYPKSTKQIGQIRKEYR